MCDWNNLQDKRRMSPCREEKDIPHKHGGMESHDEIQANVDGGIEVMSSDSGSDEEQDPLAAQGYVSLAQNEDENFSTVSIEQAEPLATGGDTSEEANENLSETKDNETVFEGMSSSAFSSNQSSQMGEDEINLIKSVMMNVQLPNSSIPEWAKDVPEEEWKTSLVTVLQDRTRKPRQNEK